MDEPIYSPDGVYMWNGSEWVPNTDTASSQDANEYDQTFLFIPTIDPQSTEPEIENSEPLSQDPHEWSLVRTDSNRYGEIGRDLPPAPDLDSADEIHTLTHYQVPIAMSNNEEDDINSQQNEERDNRFQKKLEEEFATFTVVVFESVFCTIWCLVLIILGIQLFNLVVEDEPIFVSNIKIYDDSGLETEVVVEFFEDRTQVSAESCYFTFCTDNRVVKVSESLHESICEDGKSSIPEYDCSQRMIRQIEVSESGILFPTMIVFTWYFIGNYASIRKDTVRAHSTTKIASGVLILFIIVVSFANFAAYFEIISAMFSGAVYFLSSDQAISWSTYPNLIFEAIFVIVLYYTFIHEDDLDDDDK